MLQVVLFHVITDKKEIIAVIDASFAVAKRKPSQLGAFDGLEGP